MYRDLKFTVLYCSAIISAVRSGETASGMVGVGWGGVGRMLWLAWC